jgi:phage terminase large subunit-like protein
MLFPAVYTKPLSEDFPSDADKLFQVVALAYRDMDNPDGLQLDEWQRWLLRAILERYPTDHPDPTKAGRLRYRAVVVSIPRQSGKSLIGAILGLWGVAMRTGQTLSLASSAEQALIIYNRVLHTILNNETLKKRFSKTTERRGIVSSDGLSRYDVKAMKESALQGIPLDTVLADELHLWKKGAWSAVILGTSTKPDGIVIGITTAGDETSETLLDLYAQGQRAANGDTELERFGFFNWTAPEGADVKDPGAILASNPAVECGRIPLDRIMADLATIPEHEARRYRLNQFVAGTTDSWLPGELFHQCAGSGISETDGLVLGVDITLRWEYATIAGANNLDDIIETELISSFVQPTENQLYDTITALCRKYKVRGIGIDGQRAPNLVKRLKLNGFPVWQLYGKEVAAACSQGYAMFETKKIAHNNDPLLIAQVPRGVAKYVGESWYLSRAKSFGDIDAVLATLFAVYVAASKEDSSIGVF